MSQQNTEQSYSRSRLTIVPCSLQQANGYVASLHRHHPSPPMNAGSFALSQSASLGQSGVWVELDERDLSCIRRAVPIIRGVEDGFGEQAGTREGEAMSDVLAAIVARAELTPPKPPVGADGEHTPRGRSER